MMGAMAVWEGSAGAQLDFRIRISIRRRSRTSPCSCQRVSLPSVSMSWAPDSGRMRKAPSRASEANILTTASARASPRPALSAHCRTPASIPPKVTDDKWRSRFETRLVTGCSSVCPMTSMTSTSNDSAICSNRLITTVRRAIAKSAVKTALPVANKNGKKNTDLEGQVASGCPARGPLELVAPPKFIAFDLQIAEMPAQAVQLVPSLRRFGAEFAYGRRCSLPNCPEPPFEVETGQTLLIRSELVEKQPMGGVLLRFDALDDPVFDVVEGNAVGGRFFPSAAAGASRCQRHLARELIDVQGGKTSSEGR